MEEKTIQNFHDAFIMADSNRLDMLWAQETPASLIKFYPAKYEPNGINYFLESLLSRSLWFSSPKLFNDPFDGLINYDYTQDAEKIIETQYSSLLKQQPQKNLDNLLQKKFSAATSRFNVQMIQINQKIENSMYISCFSEKENLHSSRMWGHYANNHSGVCAEYDKTDIDKTSPFTCLPVKYTDKYEYVSNPSNNQESVINFLKFFTKATEWSYEKEWRVAQKSDIRANGFRVPFALPKKIYLGCTISSKLREDIIRICLLEDIELYQMIQCPNSYRLSCISLLIRDSNGKPITSAL